MEGGEAMRRVDVDKLKLGILRGMAACTNWKGNMHCGH